MDKPDRKSSEKLDTLRVVEVRYILGSGPAEKVHQDRETSSNIRAGMRGQVANFKEGLLRKKANQIGRWYRKDRC